MNVKTLILLFISINIYAQECPIEFIDSKGTKYCTEYIESATDASSRQNDERYKVFHDYFQSSDLESFKNLFLPNEFFDLTQEGYDRWKSFLKDKKIVIEGAYLFERKGTQYFNILYAITHDQIVDRDYFTMKKYGADWYPTSRSEDEMLKEVSFAQRRIKPGFLKTSVKRLGVVSLTTALILEEQAEYNGFVKESDRYFNLEERTNAQQWFEEDRPNDPEFKTFMDSLNINQVIQEEVFSEIRKLHYLKASRILGDARGSHLWVPENNKMIIRIYGESRITYLQPNSN